MTPSPMIPTEEDRERAQPYAIRCTTISFGCGEESVYEFSKIIAAALAAERQRVKAEYTEIVKEARALCDDSCLCSATQQKIGPLRAAVEKQYRAAVDAQRADPSKEFS